MSNMDEMGLFLKLFTKKKYVLRSENSEKSIGTKDMKARARVSLYLCIKATKTVQVPMALS